MHEIVTLQFGEQSNHVGTHFWNTQESYFTYGGEESLIDHDRLFRAGRGSDGSETFTPRALIYDLKRNFGSLRRNNALYGTGDDEQTQWSGSTNAIREPHIEPSEYQQQLDAGSTTRPRPSSIRYWSDYNRIFYHPRSLVQLQNADLNQSPRSFERFETGEELFATLNNDGELLDRDLRPFLEECDQIQGMQIISGVDDAWGGFSARYLDAIRDELGKTCLFFWGLEDGSRKEIAKQNLCTANVAQSTLQIASAASVYIPLTSSPRSLPQYLARFDPGIKWYSSALQAFAIESSTLYSRLRQPGDGIRSLDHCAAAISNDNKRRIAHLEIAAQDGNAPPVTGQPKDAVMEMDGPTRIDQADSLIDMLPTTAVRHGRSRHQRRSRRTYALVTTTRGEWADADHPSRVNAPNGLDVRSTCTSTSLLFPVLDSCPDMFTFDGRACQALAVRASLSTDSVVAGRMQVLADAASSNTMPVENREELRNGLVGLGEEYLSGVEDESDESDDAA